MSAGRLSLELSERLARPVDVVLLETGRFRDTKRDAAIQRFD